MNTALCDFCHLAAHHGACPELLAYTERVKAKVFARIDNPHPCPSCGDLTAADLCAACQEDMLVDRFGISLTLRRSCWQRSVSRVVIDGMPSPF